MRPIPAIFGILTAIRAAAIPLAVNSAYWEMPGGAVTIGTGYDDPRVIWSAVIRLGLAILAILIVLRVVKDIWILRNNDNSDVESATIESLADAGKILVLSLLAAAVAPHAVNLFFNLIGGQYRMDISFV
ncbi:hypothetical protein JW899_04560 [Candidatus Uhrbacteria bacterium]|nr:hypothetical protein [Candidatus Uhrbacteria bacterium]